MYQTDLNHHIWST